MLATELDQRDYDTWCIAFELDKFTRRVTYNAGLPMPYQEGGIAETATTITTRLPCGAIQEMNKGYAGCITHELSPAVTSREEWGNYKSCMACNLPLPKAQMRRLLNCVRGKIFGLVSNEPGYLRLKELFKL